MSTHQDDPLGPVIRETLQASRTDCPDAGSIAAYAERSLASGERRDIERHLSHCARCRETLLLMEKMEKGTATVSQEAKHGGSLLFRWPWLAAAAAAGLATVIWLTLPPSAVQSPEADRAAQVITDANKQPEGLPQQPLAKTAPDGEGDVAGRKRPAKAPATPAPAEGAAATPSSAEKRTFGERERAADQRREEGKLEESPRQRAKADAPAAAREAAPPAAAPPPSVGESVAVDALTFRQNRDSVIATAPRRGSELASAIAPIAWRVLASGTVQRSVDGGASWTAEAGVDAPGARAALAPTADVCWIVGDSGLVLRFEAGRGWTRIAPPAQVAFVAIESAGARNATISASDGRRFTTADGGATWK